MIIFLFARWLVANTPPPVLLAMEPTVSGAGLAVTGGGVVGVVSQAIRLRI